MITAEQFQEWKTHPVTKEVFDELRQVKKVISERMSSGETIGLTAEETHGKTNRVIGQLEGIDQVLNVTYGNEKEDIDNVDFQSGY